MGTIIHGAETLKSIFREGFNMESLEELISLGIGGMTSQFAQILQSAFGSRMVSPSQAKRLNLKHVRGMLLYGSPTSGKPLIARNICKLLNAKRAPDYAWTGCVKCIPRCIGAENKVSLRSNQ